MVANPKDAAAFPDPLTYHVKDDGVQPAKKLTKVFGVKDYKNMKAFIKESRQLQKEKNKEAKEREEELKDKLGNKIPKFPEPIPQAYQTFDKWRVHWEKNKPKPRDTKGTPDSAGPGFGTAQRFDLNEKERYSKKIKLHNSGKVDGPELDPKADPVPGPGAYKLSEVWNGKITKLRRPYSAQPKPGERIQSSISKGPTVSVYYKK